MIPTIEPFLYGRNISDISEKHFAPWFCPNDEYPVLVLASTITVPDSPSQDWFLGEEQCGGYSCNQFQAAVLPLKILPEKMWYWSRLQAKYFVQNPSTILTLIAMRFDNVSVGITSHLLCLPG
jgi:hypothetical protein